MTEEERRRCILTGACTENQSRAQALEEELNDILEKEPWLGGDAEKERDALPILARELLARGLIGQEEKKDAAPDRKAEHGGEGL